MKTKKHTKYSPELRESVIEFIESQNGNQAESYREAGRRFKVPAGTASAWHHQWRKKIGPWKPDPVTFTKMAGFVPINRQVEQATAAKKDDLFTPPSKQILELARLLNQAEELYEELKQEIRDVLDSMEV